MLRTIKTCDPLLFTERGLILEFRSQQRRVYFSPDTPSSLQVSEDGEYWYSAGPGQLAQISEESTTLHLRYSFWTMGTLGIPAPHSPIPYGLFGNPGTLPVPQDFLAGLAFQLSDTPFAEIPPTIGAGAFFASINGPATGAADNVWRMPLTALFNVRDVQAAAGLWLGLHGHSRNIVSANMRTPPTATIRVASTDPAFFLAAQQHMTLACQSDATANEWGAVIFKGGTFLPGPFPPWAVLEVVAPADCFDFLNLVGQLTLAPRRGVMRFDFSGGAFVAGAAYRYTKMLALFPNGNEYADSSIGISAYAAGTVSIGERSASTGLGVQDFLVLNNHGGVLATAYRRTETRSPIGYTALYRSLTFSGTITFSSYTMNESSK